MLGALTKIIAYAQLVGEPISSEMANEILCHLGIEEAA
jgi:chromosomal replication initiation ATPase DnaA